MLAGYFPPPIAERFADDLSSHPLHREIITTVVVNDMINRSGTTFVHRAIEETGAEVAQITRAYSVVREVFGLRAALGRHRGARQPGADRGAARRLPGDPPARSTARRAGSSTSGSRSPTSPPRSSGSARRWPSCGPRITDAACAARSWPTSSRSRSGWSALGLPRELAAHLAELLSTFLLLDVVEIANASAHSAAEIAELHFALSDQFYVDEMLTSDHRGCRATTGGRRWPARRCDTTCTPRCRRSPRRCCARTDDALDADERTAAWTAAEPRARRPGPDDGAGGAGPRDGRSGDAVGGAAGDAQPADLIRRADSRPVTAFGIGDRHRRRDVGQASAMRAQTRLPRGVRSTPQSTRAPATMASPRPLGASGAACAAPAIVLARVLDADRRPRRAAPSTMTSRSRRPPAAQCRIALPMQLARDEGRRRR